MTTVAYKQRLEDWKRLQASEDGPDWDVFEWVTQCLELNKRYRAMLTGEPEVPSISVEEDWEGIKLFRELAFYGRYGAFLTPRKPAEGSKWLARSIPWAEGLMSCAPAMAINNIPEAILVCAKGRRILESGAGLLDPYAVSLLGGASLGRVRNLMFGKDALFSSVDGQIPVEQAEAWLKPRSGFWPSIWQDTEEPQEGQITVPKASDETVFHPGLRRRNGFTIGEKGSEVTVATYEAALEALAKMAEPRWRRPNAEGNWGIVKGTSWVTMKRKDLYELRP